MNVPGIEYLNPVAAGVGHGQIEARDCIVSVAVRRKACQREDRMHTMFRSMLMTGISLVLLSVSARADGAPDYAGVEVFRIPALVQEETALRLNSGVPGAQAKIAEWIQQYPDAASLRVTAALISMANGKDAEAIRHLQDADAKGATRLGALLQHPTLARIASDSRLADIRDKPAGTSGAPPPALVKQGVARVSPSNSTWDPEHTRITTHFAFPPVLRTHAYVDGKPTGPIAELQRLVARGFAAGNAGDLYDNRDDGHSTLHPGKRTQLSHIVYDPNAKAAGVHYGLNTQFLFDAPTFGNSSTALTGGLWRSQPRFALTSPGGAMGLWQLYANNHIYIFPEHRDHDPRADGGHGDLLPALTPYALISQGSSGSDRPLMLAVQAVLAAFPPKVKQRLIDAKLIAPMVQRIIRQTLTGEHDYLDPAAHPTVIQAEDLDLAALIKAAQALQPDTIPPAPHIRLLRETPPHASIFGDGLSEVLFDTPGAVARVWRSGLAQRAYEIDVQAQDPNGRDLRFHWRVLRGDPDAVRIVPQDEAGRRVQIALRWQTPQPAPRQPDILVPRVDIGVFADNGSEVSSPAIFSVLFPTHQTRVYDEAGRMLSMDHRLARGRYADPLIWPARDWQDTFLYDAERRTIGWTRRRSGKVPGALSQFTAHGLKVIETGPNGRITLAQRVTYPVTRNDKGALVVAETPADQYFRYEYKDERDRIGRPIPTASPVGQD